MKKVSKKELLEAINKIESVKEDSKKYFDYVEAFYKLIDYNPCNEGLMHTQVKKLLLMLK